METVRETNLPLGVSPRRGKVRDCYEMQDYILLVASDRMSAFDVVMPTGIPDKGRVLNLLSAFWFERTGHLVENHMVTAEADRIIGRYPSLAGSRGLLDGRAMLCRRAEPVPVECVVRGYLAGSAWSEYKERGTVAELPLPKNLPRSHRFDPPLFTPAIKAASGHDENISVGRMEEIVGKELAGKIIRTSLALYEFASALVAPKGLLIADTKFEFGMRDGDLLLIDEAFTPDSSRFWLADQYQPGKDQKGFDKQPLRDWLQNLTDQGKWNKTPPGPELPDEVVQYMSDLYRRVYTIITGGELPKKQGLR